ncbi:MAG: hypothetical protein JWM16_2977, partial [Verrucomicrobiales bacterium]|nr:hypothetical protein [Verrucomicrobiales bacterium]
PSPENFAKKVKGYDSFCQTPHANLVTRKVSIMRTNLTEKKRATGSETTCPQPQPYRVHTAPGIPQSPFPRFAHVERPAAIFPHLKHAPARSYSRQADALIKRQLTQVQSPAGVPRKAPAVSSKAMQAQARPRKPPEKTRPQALPARLRFRL